MAWRAGCCRELSLNGRRSGRNVIIYSEITEMVGLRCLALGNTTLVTNASKQFGHFLHPTGSVFLSTDNHKAFISFRRAVAVERNVLPLLPLVI